jgi:formylglycine-generating enzyme required for sulfatase activity
MGCVPDDTECDVDEGPRHAVTLTRPFDLMTTEVTVGMYRQFAQATGAAVRAQPDWSRSEAQPVVSVTWDEAAAFCRWAGGRLPTEAEWERAARGAREGETYPWGRQEPSDVAGAPDGARFGAKDGAVAVGRFAPNGFGLYDMAGNVWEWVADWYGLYSGRAMVDPPGPSSGSGRVLRGGAWDGLPWFLHLSFRFSDAPGFQNYFDGFGFRCAQNASP